MNDVMLDLETLGVKPGSKVLSIGAVFFGPEGLDKEFYIALDKNDQGVAGLVEDPDTLEWWSKQSPESRTVLNTPTAPTIYALSQFNEFLGYDKTDTVRLWGNGAGFDQPLLATVYWAMGITTNWKFYNDRCYRTLKSMYKHLHFERTGVHHNALDDAKSQAQHCIQLLNACGGWES